MKQRTNSFIMIVTILLVAFFYHYFNYKYPKENKIVAIVEDQKLYYSDFEDFAKKQDIEINENTRNLILDDMVAQKVILIYAEKSGIMRRELEKDINKQKEMIKLNLIAERFFDVQTLEFVVVSNKELKKYYRNHIFYAIRAMNFEKKSDSAQREAISVLQRLKTGELFKELQSEIFSNGDSKYIDQIVITDLEDATDELKKEIIKLKKQGDYSGIVESKNYYSLYYRDSTPSFTQAKEYIYKKLYYTKKEKIRTDLVNKLTNSITVNYYEISKMMADTTDSYAFYRNENLAVSNMYKQKLTIADFLKKAKDDYGIENIHFYKEKEVQELVKTIMLQKVILKYAEQLKFFNNPIFKKELSKKMVDLDVIIAEQTIAYMLENYLKIDEPTISEIQREYYDNQDLYRKSSLFKLQEIYIKKKNIAEEVLEKAKKGYNFDSLVMSYSEDEDKYYSKGKTPYYNANDLGREYRFFEKYKKGDIMHLREDLYGNYIVTKILDIQSGALPDLNSSRNEVIKRIYSRRINAKLEDICNDYSIHTRKYYENLVPEKKSRTRKLAGFN
ncbi:MAG: peptidylprolyl isomerase [Candidatus Cloacimonadales bacterium]|nr:peptidylprolyl isomerase [Candidatus Cloacimonadales bacterium]